MQNVNFKLKPYQDSIFSSYKTIEDFQHLNLLEYLIYLVLWQFHFRQLFQQIPGTSLDKCRILLTED